MEELNLRVKISKKHLVGAFANSLSNQYNISCDGSGENIEFSNPIMVNGDLMIDVTIKEDKLAK